MIPLSVAALVLAALAFMFSIFSRVDIGDMRTRLNLFQNCNDRTHSDLRRRIDTTEAQIGKLRRNSHGIDP